MQNLNPPLSTAAGSALPRIAVYFLGGTIAMVPGADGTIVPALSGPDLMRSIDGLDRIASLDVVSFMMVPSPSIRLLDMCELARALNARVAELDGVVVVQGTDTIEETAFVLEMLVARSLPVVVTGAMRGPRDAGADGPANLRAAIIVACSPAVATLGVTVVLNDEIHAAAFVQKSHSSLLSAFRSPNNGPLGIVAEGRAYLHAAPRRRMGMLRPPHADAPVALLKIGLDDDGRLLPRLAELGYRGVVIEGMGVGHVPAALAPLIGALAPHMPVVLSTRVASGRIYSATYGFAGSESDLRARGIIGAGSLGGLKARLLLQLLLGCGATMQEVRDAFAVIEDPLAD